MKKIIAVLVCFALLVSGVAVLAGCGKQKAKKEDPTENGITGGEIAGGWMKADSPAITEEFRKVFDRATQALTGMQYTPVAYLASQVVAGTNHRVLCKATAAVPDAAATYAVVTVYEDLNGNAEITEVADSDAQATVADGDVDGGWSEPDSPDLPEDALQALTKACETLTGAEYTPVALLAAQIVAGTNYRILCESRATVPDAETEYVIVTVYADPQGNAEITETVAFASEPLSEIANPLVEYGSSMDSLSAAQEAVGFTLTVPGSVTPENFIVISGATLEVDFDGGYIRKAKGGEDISGDYNAYDAVETKTAEGKDVTLKGNAGKFMLAIWTEGDYTYCVGVTDGRTEAEMLSLVNGIK